MKIKVGKTYTDKVGREGYVECLLKRPPDKKFPYLVTYHSGGLNYYNENGESCLGYANFVEPLYESKWVGLFQIEDGTFWTPSTQSNTKEQCTNMWKDTTGFIRAIRVAEIIEE